MEPLVLHAEDLLGQTIKIDIAANTPLEAALIQWGMATRITVMTNTSAIHGKLTPRRITGTFNARRVLSELLQSTGLSYTEDRNLVQIVPDPAIKQSALEYRAPEPASSIGASYRVYSYLASAGGSSEEAGRDSGDDIPDHNILAEVVITAQKRQERLQDVPVPVSVVDADELVENDRFSLHDFANTVPGLSFADDGTGTGYLSIRGLVPFGGNPTVAILIDDVPYGAATGLQFGTMADVDPDDLARIEVLRGPQGTLYGASSIGGLIKYVTVDPSPAGISGQVHVGTSGVSHGAELGYNVGGSINLPITDTLALRASAYGREEPGYIDNVISGSRGVNEGKFDGARIAAKWFPSDALSIKVSAIYQESKIDGASHVDLGSGLGTLQTNEIPNTGGIDRTLWAYSATINAKVGSSQLTALTGYNTQRYVQLVDFDGPFGFLDPITQQLINIPNDTTQVGVSVPASTSKVTQELRLDTPLGSHVNWLIGGFYTHERSPVGNAVFALQPDSGEFVANYGGFFWYSTYTEFAAFTDLTWHVTNQFEIQVGGRESHIKESYAETDSGSISQYFYGTAPYYWPEVVGQANAFTYLVTPQFKISPDMMVYARLASGYRPGGPNPEAGIGGGVPLFFSPDKSQDYELGFKGDPLGPALSIDASFYYVTWKNLQLPLTVSGLGFTGNGGDAKSEGIELSFGSKPFSGLSLAAWVAYNDATTVSLPATSSVYAVPGEPLPFSSRWSGNFSVDHGFPLTASIKGFVGGSVAYVGVRNGNYAPFPAPDSPLPSPRAYYPSYAQINLNGGMKRDHWTVNIFANNVTDKRGVTTGGIYTGATPSEYTYIRPRTIGAQISWKF